MASSGFNLPLMSIPLYYIIASIPHAYAASVATKGNLGKYDNRSPHSANSIDRIKKSLSAAEFGKWERAKRAHVNAMENMPLFVAAVFAGLLAERTTGSGLVKAESVGLESFVVGILAARVVYTLNYIMTETVTWSYLRSVMYIGSTVWSFVVIAKAAYVLGA